MHIACVGNGCSFHLDGLGLEKIMDSFPHISLADKLVTSCNDSFMNAKSRNLPCRADKLFPQLSVTGNLNQANLGYIAYRVPNR